MWPNPSSHLGGWLSVLLGDLGFLLGALPGHLASAPPTHPELVSLLDIFMTRGYSVRLLSFSSASVDRGALTAPSPQPQRLTRRRHTVVIHCVAGIRCGRKTTEAPTDP